GQVEYTVGPRGPEHLSCGAGLGQIAVHRRDVLVHAGEVVGRGARQDGAHHLRALAESKLREMAAGEAGDARDQDLHGAPLRRACASARGDPSASPRTGSWAPSPSRSGTWSNRPPGA